MTIQQKENTLVLLATNAEKSGTGRDSYNCSFKLHLDFNFFGDEKVFTCSDADRPVIIKEIIN